MDRWHGAGESLGTRELLSCPKLCLALQGTQNPMRDLDSHHGDRQCVDITCKLPKDKMGLIPTRN